MSAPSILDTAMYGLAALTGGAIFASQLDDLFIDANYFLRRLHHKKRRAIPLAKLERVKQKRIAILVPAWKEAEVIQEMLEHNLRTLDYDKNRYDIFCGTYKNDPETQAKVDRVTRVAKNIHKVVVPHDGPTSKADCLNWVYQGIVLEEERRGRRFDILLMHDAEDSIHPLSLRLYSLLIPKHDFVQTPVFSFDLPPKELVAGTYLDEFGEHHLKDMLVRQAIGGLVPSAGVGSAFSRKAFEEIAAAHGQRVFDTESVTEDYELGLKFRLAGKKVCFACRTIDRGPKARGGREEYIATREYFPGGLSASIRQRSRWILGITLQTWEKLGWRGALPVLYCLWRDRKALLSNAVVLGAYALVLYVALRSCVSAITGAPWSFSEILPETSPLRYILAINLALVVWRAGMKAWLVSRLYGPVQGAVSVPRAVLVNVIGLSATARAVVQYIGHRITGKPLRWLKTTHTFIGPDALRAASDAAPAGASAESPPDAPELEQRIEPHVTNVAESARSSRRRCAQVTERGKHVTP